MPVDELLTLKEIVRETDRLVTTSKGEAVDGQFNSAKVMAGLVAGAPAEFSTVTEILVSAKAREHHRRDISKSRRFMKMP
jgi:hypothetical protein